MERDRALQAIADGEVDPSAATVVWLVDGKPVVQSLNDFTVPDLYDVERVRRIGSHESAKAKPGWYPVDRDGDRLYLEAESRLELHWLRALSMEPGVTWFHTQPFVIYWPVDNRAIVQYPDIVAIKNDQMLVIEVKPDCDMHLYARATFALTEAACSSVGVGFERRGQVSKQEEVNYIAVAGHRVSNPAYVEHVRRVVAARPETAHRLFNLCGDDGAGREVLYELRAAGAVLFNMDEPIRRATDLTWLVAA